MLGLMSPLPPPLLSPVLLSQERRVTSSMDELAAMLDYLRQEVRPRLPAPWDLGQAPSQAPPAVPLRADGQLVVRSQMASAGWGRWAPGKDGKTLRKSTPPDDTAL